MLNKLYILLLFTFFGTITFGQTKSKIRTVYVKKLPKETFDSDFVKKNETYISPRSNANRQLSFADSLLKDEWTRKDEKIRYKRQLLFDRLVCDVEGNFSSFYVSKKLEDQGFILLNTKRCTKSYSIKVNGYTGKKFEGSLNIVSKNFTVNNVRYKLVEKKFKDNTYKKKLTIYMPGINKKGYVSFYTKI